MVKNSPEIQKFLDSVKNDTAKNGKECSLISFGDFWEKKYSANDTNFNLKAFLGDVNNILSHNQLVYFSELTCYRKKIARIVLPAKKVIRKMVAFIFLPIIAEQNEINLNTARLFEQLRAYVNCENSGRKMTDLRTKELENMIRSQRIEIDELKKLVEELSSKGNKGGKKK